MAQPQYDGSTVGMVPDHVPEELVYQWQEPDFPEYEYTPYEVYRKLAKAKKPIFYTPEHFRSLNYGAWVVTSAQYCREVLQQPDPFCTSIRFASDNSAYPGRLIPLGMDPPEHMKYRMLIAPIFSPKAIDAMESEVYRVCNEVMDTFATRGEVDFMREFARVFPGIIFMQIMGLPLDMKERFFYWEEKIFHDGTPEEKRAVGQEVGEYLYQLIDEKRAHPANDLVSTLLAAEVDGKKLDDVTIRDCCFLMYIAGLDTVNGGLGHVFRYLAEHPDDQQRLREHPEKIPAALEELLRIHAWIGTTRVLSRDHEFHGVKMKKDERIIVMNPIASWDEDRFENAFEVDLEREVNPHLAFGGGVHRCAGSYLARRELRVAMAEWLRRIPQWQITAGEKVPYFSDGLLSMRRLPLSWDGSKAI